MVNHLARVKYSLFVYDDDVVEALLKSVFDKASDAGRTTTMSAALTYEPPGDAQYFLAWYGTLVLGEENCDKCDAVCPLNPTPGDALVVEDLSGDVRTRESKLVTDEPWLTSYGGVRISNDLSIIVLYSGQTASRASLERASEVLVIVANIVPSLLSAKEDDDDDHALRLVVDLSGVVVRASKACDHYFGESVVGKPPERLAADPSALETLLASSSSAAVLDLRSGRKARVSVEMRRRVRVLSVTDATDAKDLEQKRKELEVQRKVLSQFAHELRNKFTASAAVLDQVYECLDGSTELKTEVSAAKLLLNEANQLIHTRLSLYNMFKQTYDATSNLQVVDLKEWLEGLASNVRLQVKHGVEIRVVCPSTAIELDSYVANHVFTHLFNNSSKYTTRGHIEIAVCGVSSASIVFAVYDTGHGVPEAAREYLFESDVISADARGTGLGLSSCGLFLRAINGRIWLESSKTMMLDDDDDGRDDESSGGHTDIRFQMPCRVVVKSKQHRARDNNNNNNNNNAVFLPLVSEVHLIEDSELIRKMIVRKFTAAFKDNKPSFKEYNTVEEALEAMRNNLPGPNTLVSVDENLQSKGGFLLGGTMISYLKQHSYRGLIVSASGDDGATKRHIDLGAHCSLGKPLPKSLFPVLQDGFKRRLAQSSNETLFPPPLPAFAAE
ncbi:hypothetical protein CTAYLR_009643 [Chrysophaeum taylorii]|uniref:histidine kinase n=1 Tax=Chrysophaeum taylorii TaxID=2483200 RepID=A0AAD7U642_9STRA|nr:hypothetical protein CTAYLR_009643 [Chrysophaeum taylorii]